jgi:hypothetical protein
MTPKSIVVIDSLGCISVSTLVSINQRVLKKMSNQYIPISSLTRDLLTSKCKWFIYYLDCTGVTSLMSIKQKFLNILSSLYIPMSSVIHDLWPTLHCTCNNLKINSNHLFFKMYQGIKFDVDQVKGEGNFTCHVMKFCQSTMVNTA